MTNPPSPSLALAIVHGPGLSGEPDAMIDRLAARLAGGTYADARLLVLPELWLSGYFDAAAVRAGAEPADGPSFHRIAALAHDHRLAIAYGYAERDDSGDRVYNSARLVGPDGADLLNYRKINLWGDYERALFTAGVSPSAIARLDGWGIGFSICYDTEFPETVRDLARRGADLVIAPTAVGAEFPVVTDMLVRVRAYENGVYLAFANRSGIEHGYAFAGLSAIIAPEGEVLARADATGIGDDIAARLDLDALVRARARNPYLADLRWNTTFV